MKKKFVLIHTGAGVVSAISSIVQELNPDLDIINLVDDSTIRAIAANNNVVPSSVVRRLSTLFVFAEELGAVGALLTCSSVNEVVDVASKLVSIPCFKIDQPMADKAIGFGSKIGVAATLKTTMEPTKRLISARAALARKEVVLDESLCAGAYDAWSSGDADTHDRIVGEAIEKLAERNDVVVLAQASMARAIEPLSVSLKEKVLTSPRLGVTAALKALDFNISLPYKPIQILIHNSEETMAKKVLFVLLTAVILIGLLAGCAAPTPNAPENQAEAPAAPNSSSEESSPTTISILYMQHWAPGADEVIKNKAIEWGKTKNAEIQFDMIPEKDFEFKVANAVENKSGPDVVLMRTTAPILYQDSLVDITDVANEIIERDGDFYQANKAESYTGSAYVTIPLYSVVPVWFYQIDKLKEFWAFLP